jgi:hypothetical protein
MKAQEPSPMQRSAGALAFSENSLRRLVVVMSDINTYMDKLGKGIAVAVRVPIMGLCVWVIKRLLPRVAAARKSGDGTEPIVVKIAAYAIVLCFWAMEHLRLRAAAAWEFGDEAVTKQLCEYGRDEESGISWGWSPERFEATMEGHFVKVFSPPQPGLAPYGEIEWTMLMFRPEDQRDESAIEMGMRLPLVLHLCGVERCRQAMVLAHQRATRGAKRRGADHRVIAHLERQLFEVGGVVPRDGESPGS